MNGKKHLHVVKKYDDELNLKEAPDEGRTAAEQSDEERKSAPNFIGHEIFICTRHTHVIGIWISCDTLNRPQSIFAMLNVCEFECVRCLPFTLPVAIKIYEKYICRYTRINLFFSAPIFFLLFSSVVPTKQKKNRTERLR